MSGHVLVTVVAPTDQDVARAIGALETAGFEVYQAWRPEAVTS